MSSWLKSFLDSARKHTFRLKNVAQKTYPVSQVQELTVQGLLDVRVYKGDKCSLRIYCTDENDLGLVDVAIDGGKVKVCLPPSAGEDKDETITSSTKYIFGTGIWPFYEVIRSSGDSEHKSLRSVVWVEIVCPDVANIDVIGGGSVCVHNLEQKVFNVSVVGPGDVSASGCIDAVRASIQGSGFIDIAMIQCNSATLSVTGSGDIEAFAHKTVKAVVQGSGEIYIHGKPISREININGVGEICFG